MNKKNVAIGLVVLVLVVLAVVLLVPYDSGYQANADRNCPPAYGYNNSNHAPCPPPRPHPRPLLYRWLNIGQERD